MGLFDRKSYSSSNFLNSHALALSLLPLISASPHFPTNEESNGDGYRGVGNASNPGGSERGQSRDLREPPKGEKLLHLWHRQPLGDRPLLWLRRRYSKCACGDRAWGQNILGTVRLARLASSSLPGLLGVLPIRLIRHNQQSLLEVPNHEEDCGALLTKSVYGVDPTAR